MLVFPVEDVLSKRFDTVRGMNRVFTGTNARKLGTGAGALRGHQSAWLAACTVVLAAPSQNSRGVMTMCPEGEAQASVRGVGTEVLGRLRASKCMRLLPQNRTSRRLGGL